MDSRKIGFRYFALCFGDKAMNDLSVVHETKNDKKEIESQGRLAGAITYLYRLVITVFFLTNGYIFYSYPTDSACVLGVQLL